MPSVSPVLLSPTAQGHSTDGKLRALGAGTSANPPRANSKHSADGWHGTQESFQQRWCRKDNAGISQRTRWSLVCSLGDGNSLLHGLPKFPNAFTSSTMNSSLLYCSAQQPQLTRTTLLRIPKYSLAFSLSPTSWCWALPQRAPVKFFL